jgi:hypothetical protein
LPYGCDFALNFVLDVVDRRLRRNSYNPFHTFIKLNEEIDVIATIGGFLEYPARLEAVMSGY